MSVLETNDKKQLLKKSWQQREALEHEVTLLSEKTEKVLTNTLIIGGSLAVSYLLMRQFFKSKKKTGKKSKAVAKGAELEEEHTEHHPSFFSSVASEIGMALATQLTAFLLEIAREKLVEYLESHTPVKKEKDADS